MTFALGPLDGRYRATTTPLTAYLSEAALNRERIRVEIEWLIFLSREGVVPGAPVVDKDDTRFLRSIPTSFGQAEVAELAAIPATTSRRSNTSSDGVSTQRRPPSALQRSCRL